MRTPASLIPADGRLGSTASASVAIGASILFIALATTLSAISADGPKASGAPSSWMLRGALSALRPTPAGVAMRGCAGAAAGLQALSKPV